MIVGTAGHIDHGKTSLVRALTGVDTDRLPEEKKRGIPIELGYAFMDSPMGQRIGFIDVPGHERLVHTMVAGATGIDLALLLVAADDGVMPQTREHLAVISLLGIAGGAVVITKSDLVDQERLGVVKHSVGEILMGTTLQGSPVFTVSSATGEGVEALREWLWACAERMEAHPRLGHAFRLAVDRSFTIAGLGTVVTGTIHAGQVSVGDELTLVPVMRKVRVRSLHAQNREVVQAFAGQRCAIGLAGVGKEDVSKGDWLAATEVAHSTSRIDAHLALWPHEDRPLRSGTPVHLHAGSVSVMASVAVLDPVVVEPGGQAFVQFVLHKPIGAWYGDRIVLRDAAASRTVAGAMVLDPFAPVRYRRTPDRLSMLHAMMFHRERERLAAALASSPLGVDLTRWRTAHGVRSVELPVDAMHLKDAHHEMILHPVHADRAFEKVLATLSVYHQQHPDELGPDLSRLRRLSLPRMPEPLARAICIKLQASGRLVVKGSVLHLPVHAVRLSVAEERIAQKVAPILKIARFDGAWVRDLAKSTSEPEAIMRVTLSRLAQRGELHQVVKDLFYPNETITELAAICRRVAEVHEGVVLAANYRDATGLGRKRAIQILEHFDRIGLLRRVGDLHRLRHESHLFEEVVAL